MFTDSDSLANTVKKDVGQSHDKRFRIVVSMLREGFRAENISLQWLPTHMRSRRPSDEDDGKGRSRLILQQSCVSICGQEGVSEQGQRKCLNVVLPRNKFRSLPAKSSASDSRFCLFAVTGYDPSFVEFFFVLCSSRIHLNTTMSVFFWMHQLFSLCEWFENYSLVSVNAGFTTGGRGRGSVTLTCSMCQSW